MPKGFYRKSGLPLNTRRGIKLSDTIKENMSITKKGKIFSKKHKENLSVASLGSKKSKLHRKNISKAKSGIKHTEQWNKSIALAHQGNKSHFWKGGITPVNKIIRNSIEYSLWRNSVFARDGYTCQKYGIIGEKLHAHHILNFSQYPELRFAIDNGITLSKKAHKEFHKKYGKKNNTKEQLLEFLS